MLCKQKLLFSLLFPNFIRHHVHYVFLRPQYKGWVILEYFCFLKSDLGLSKKQNKNKTSWNAWKIRINAALCIAIIYFTFIWKKFGSPEKSVPLETYGWKSGCPLLLCWKNEEFYAVPPNFLSWAWQNMASNMFSQKLKCTQVSHGPQF